MINEDIITSLKNAVTKGETIENAVSIAINSGYNRREVEDAAKFIGSGVINMERLGSERLLAMPNEKGFFKKAFNSNKVPPPVQKIPPNSNIPVQKPNYPKQTPYYISENKISNQSAEQINNATPESLMISSTQKKNPMSSFNYNNEPKINQNIQPLPKDQSANVIKESFTNEPIQPYKEQSINPQPYNQIKKTPRQSYAKEIILLIILLLLIAVLIVFAAYREQIIGFFSSR